MQTIKNFMLISFFLSSVLFSQQARDSQNFLSNQSTINTKSLQEYYQNVFKSNQQTEQKKLQPSYDINKEDILAKIKESIPLSGPINPDQYLVGPGDLLEVDVWSQMPLNFTLPVTPEGILLIPSFGAIDVKNLTLSQVKEKVKRELRRDYLTGEITTTLISPRIFTVDVSGLVNNPGSFFAAATQRVDAAIYQANLTTNLPGAVNENQFDLQKRDLLNRSDVIEYFNEDKLTEKPLKMSMRNIKLIRNFSGDTLKVDLVRFYATGDNKYNPYLQDGDRIIVPNIDLKGNSITVSGAVLLEGTYEYLKGDSLSSVFEIAQGPQAIADLEHVDLYRFDGVTGRNIHLVVNYKKIKSGSEKDIPLLPNDRIVVREKYPRPIPQGVIVKGEVKKPGLYPVVKNKTTLTDVIKAAGGFTSNASLAESKIIRTKGSLDAALQNPDYDRLIQMRLSDMDKEQREYYNFEAAIKRKTLSVDFLKIFKNNSDSSDVFLEDGDVILIPTLSNVVFIYGQVAYPGYLTYQKSVEYEYYISQAGGTTEMADEADIRVIKAGSNVWLDPDDTNIEPGDVIWIPREKERTFGFYFNWFSRIVAVIGGVATVFLLVK